jgi:hypothetical protein
VVFHIVPFQWVITRHDHSPQESYPVQLLRAQLSQSQRSIGQDQLPKVKIQHPRMLFFHLSTNG